MSVTAMIGGIGIGFDPANQEFDVGGLAGVSATASDRELQHLLGEDLRQRKRKQLGIGYPSGTAQESQWVVRLNLTDYDPNTVRVGLLRLGRFLKWLNYGELDSTGDMDRDKAIYGPEMEDIHFSATLGFGAGFFEKLNLGASRPQDLALKIDAVAPGAPKPRLEQTDMILLLGASARHHNRRALGVWPRRSDLPSPAWTIIGNLGYDWAEVVEVHEGFRRSNHRNWFGFEDGTSNPQRLSKFFDEVVWDEDGGTFLSFLKIVTDLDVWEGLTLNEQEQWVGRRRRSGLVRGSLSLKDEADLLSRIEHNDPAVREAGLEERQALMKAWKQDDPTAQIFSNGILAAIAPSNVVRHGCPEWSHMRRANPRDEDDFIYRRGCLFLDDLPSPRSGILFISFQHSLAAFQRIMRDTALLNQGQLEALEMPTQIASAEAKLTTTLGGGYYYIPPMNGDPTELGQQFFAGLI